MERNTYGISTNFFETKASGVLHISSSDDIGVDIACRPDSPRAAPSSEDKRKPFSLYGETHTFRPFVLINGSIASDLIFKTNESRRETKIIFEYAIFDTNCKSYNDKKFMGFDFEIDGLDSFIPYKGLLNNRIANSTDCIDYLNLTLSDSVEISLRSSIKEMLSINSRETTNVHYFTAKSPEPISLNEIVENYMNPICEFMTIMANKNQNVTKLSVFEAVDSYAFKVYSPKFKKENTFVHPMIDIFLQDSQEALKLFIENHKLVKHYTRKICPDLMPLHPSDLINDVEKIYKTVNPNGLAKDYRSKLNYLLGKQSHLLRLMIPDTGLWSKRVKSHRSYFVHRADDQYFDDETIREIDAIVRSISYLFLFTILDFLGVNSKVKRMVKDSFEFQRDAKFVSKNINGGRVPMDNGLSSQDNS